MTQYGLEVDGIPILTPPADGDRVLGVEVLVAELYALNRRPYPERSPEDHARMDVIRAELAARSGRPERVRVSLWNAAKRLEERLVSFRWEGSAALSVEAVAAGIARTGKRAWPVRLRLHVSDEGRLQVERAAVVGQKPMSVDFWADQVVGVHSAAQYADTRAGEETKARAQETRRRNRRKGEG